MATSWQMLKMDAASLELSLPPGILGSASPVEAGFPETEKGGAKTMNARMVTERISGVC
jgi:hypothetical protein